MVFRVRLQFFPRLFRPIPSLSWRVWHAADIGACKKESLNAAHSLRTDSIEPEHWQVGLFKWSQWHFGYACFGSQRNSAVDADAMCKRFEHTMRTVEDERDGRLSWIVCIQRLGHSSQYVIGIMTPVWVGRAYSNGRWSSSNLVWMAAIDSFIRGRSVFL